MSSSRFFDYSDTPLAERPDEFVLLPDLDERDWVRLLAYTVRRRFSRGELLVREGDEDRSLYIIGSGALATSPPSNGARRSTVMAAGTMFGEIAFFDGKPRSASVRAVAEGEVLVLSFEAFEVFAAREPLLARRLLLDLGRILAARLRRAESATGL